MSFAMICVLRLSPQNDFLSSSTSPRASGVKVQDLWFLSCILFVLAAIAEYAVCLYLKRSLTAKKRRQRERQRLKREKVNPHRLFKPRDVSDNIEKWRLCDILLIGHENGHTHMYNEGSI